MSDPIYVLASLPRSGTHSMCAMADLCGIRSRHVCHNLTRDLRRGFRFFADTPFYSPEYLLALHDMGLDLRVLYTTRPLADIELSYDRTGLRDYKRECRFEDMTSRVEISDALCWAGVRDPEWRAAHRTRVESMCRALRIPFLAYDPASGWEPFCSFVSRTVPAVPVPMIPNKLSN